MGRRSSFASGYAQRQREAARAQAAQGRARAAARREADRAQAAYARAQFAEEKERKRLYVESRAAHVAAMNADLDGQTGLQVLAGDSTMLYYMSEEGSEGKNAFLEKRQPDFRKYPWRP